MMTFISSAEVQPQWGLWMCSAVTLALVLAMATLLGDTKVTAEWKQPPRWDRRLVVLICLEPCAC